MNELFIKGTENSLPKDNMHETKDIDSATGLLWEDGCTGPKVSKEFLDFSQVEPRFPQWQKYTEEWAARAAKGPGTRGGPKHTATTYFFDGFLVPFGRSWGGKFAPTDVCKPVPVCEPGGGPPTPEPTGIVERLHEGAVADLHVEDDRLRAGRELLRHDRRGDQ